MSTSGHHFEADPVSIPAARRFVIDALREHGVDRWPADLLVTELATNVLTHAATEFEVVVHVDGVVRVSVADDSLGTPEVKAPSPDAVSGRGMSIVDTLATRWGVDRRPSGKVVWFELPSPD